MRSLLRVLGWFFGLVLVFALAVYLAMQVSPWPGVVVIRWIFDQGAAKASAALEPHVPPGVTALLDEVYDARSASGKLDVYYPSAFNGTDRRATTVVWIHGGGFVSGRKEDIGNYGRVLAGRGFVVISVDYTIAPISRYPEPVRQVNTALGWITANAARLHVNPEKIVLAGDSAGSHIAAQLANAISVPAYARELSVVPAISRQQLAGALLYCGVYGVDGLNLDGPFGGFLRTVVWAYLGRKNLSADPRLETFNVTRHVTADFPPVFISAGNADPLLPQSLALAGALKAQGVTVSELFFPEDQEPKLGHEYQFNLDLEPGRRALERSVEFLSRL